MKKKIIIGVFSLLILITAIAFVFMAIDTYNYEVANDDIMVGFGALMVSVIGVFVIFYLRMSINEIRQWRKSFIAIVF